MRVPRLDFVLGLPEELPRAGIICTTISWLCAV
jgi:hypothetical protein